MSISEDQSLKLPSIVIVFWAPTFPCGFVAYLSHNVPVEAFTVKDTETHDISINTVRRMLITFLVLFIVNLPPKIFTII